MTRSILDTSVVLASGVEPIEGELAISAVTLAELHFGVLVAVNPHVRAERLRRVDEVARRFDALPMDRVVAQAYGRVAAAVVVAGRQPRARSLDLLIAATALRHGAVLRTRNTDDFRGLEELVEVRYA